MRARGDRLDRDAISQLALALEELVRDGAHTVGRDGLARKEAVLDVGLVIRRLGRRGWLLLEAGVHEAAVVAPRRGERSLAHEELREGDRVDLLRSAELYPRRLRLALRLRHALRGARDEDRGVVLEVGAHTGEILHHLHAALLEVLLRADPARHQQVRRADRAEREQRLAVRRELGRALNAICVHKAHACRALAAVKHDPSGLRGGDDVEVRATEHGVEV
mmetsp:Transcript_20229/g.52207  ORF Transcript_20229/g.52207 Transcript_20229/m.52207 type:complete len:221 (-) Transcript_20229:638-1300(-)